MDSLLPSKDLRDKVLLLPNSHVPNIVKLSNIRASEFKTGIFIAGHARNWVAYTFKKANFPKAFSKAHLQER